MEQTNEQFDKLRKLLTTKTIDRPAPDYFEDLPSRVRERIESMPPPPPPTWFERMMAVFEYRPVQALAYGVVICGGVYIGMRFSETMRQIPLPRAEVRSWMESAPLTLQSSPMVGNGSREQTLAGTSSPFEAPGVVRQTGAMRTASGSLFVTHGSNSDFQKASFQP